jgi:protein-tyrosine-phosphatase
MAAGLLRQRLAQEGLDSHSEVASAGIWAAEDAPASENAVAVMAERGIDIGEHRAHSITARDVSAATLILVMSREHEEVIRSTWPQYEWKLHRLSEMVGKRKNIPDPYRGPIEEYRESANIIADYIERGFQRILELA